MIKYEITKILNQFKRVHKSQIKPKEAVLSNHVFDQMKRKNLKNLDDIQLHILLLQVMVEISIYQKNREKPHQGIDLFKGELDQLVSRLEKNRPT